MDLRVTAEAATGGVLKKLAGKHLCQSLFFNKEVTTGTTIATTKQVL